MHNENGLDKIKNEILEKLNVEEYFSKYIKGIHHEGPKKIKCLCPFHEEKTPSFSIDFETGLWYDHGQCKIGGSIFDFYMKVNSCDFMTALKALAKEANVKLPDNIPQKDSVPTIDKIEADTFHKALVESQTNLDAFVQKRGLSLETIKKFNIGYDVKSSRYTIPVYDKHGNLVNIRKYDMNNVEKGRKMLNYIRPTFDENGKQKKDKDGRFEYEHVWGNIKIFNIKRLFEKTKHNRILISEGETDCMMAEQNGFETITVTGGAGSFNQDWKKYFEGKIIYICYDLDLAGTKGALRVAEILESVAEKIYIVKLPDELGSGGDITDYFVKFKHTAEEFAHIVEASKTYEDILQEQEEIFDVNLAQTTQAKYRAKKIRTEVLVSGKGEPAYIIPSRILCYCNGGGAKRCAGCALNKTEQLEYIVDPKNPEVLEFINCTKDKQIATFKNILGILQGCKQCEMEFPEGEFINLEEVRVVPKIDMSITNVTYVEKVVYYLGEGIKTNRTYKIEGYVFPDPIKQLATVIVDRALESNDNIDEFIMTPEKKKELEIFQLQPGQKIMDKLKDKYDDLERNVTHIWGRKDMMLAFDLTMHSALWIKHDNEIIKGWINSFIIGDTATGKTEMLSKLREHYGVGERIGGQGLTIPGLIGAVVQTNNGRWMLRWGILALNDRRALIIEEVTDMPSDIMEKLTDIMSSGTVSINKANGHEKTNARTRLMFVSNTKRGAKLESYGDGPAAIREIIMKDEDIRRMDFILTVAKNEVASDEINMPISSRPPVEHKYKDYLCRNLTMWGWSRGVDDIIFEEGASTQVFESTKKLLGKFHDKFPLIESGDTKNKIRRGAVALAIVLFSCDETGQKVIVKKEHVQFIEWWYNHIYCKPSMAYDMFSEDAKRKYTLTDARKIALVDSFKMLPDWESLAKTLWESQIFKKSDIGDRTGYDKDELRVVFKWLSNNWLIRSIGNHGYRKENILVDIIKGLLKELEHSHNIDEVYIPDSVKKTHHHEEHIEHHTPPIEKKVDVKENRVGTEQAGGLFS